MRYKIFQKAAEILHKKLSRGEFLEFQERLAADHTNGFSDIVTEIVGKSVSPADFVSVEQAEEFVNRFKARK